MPARAHAPWIALVLAGCAAREVPVQPAETIALPSAVATTTVAPPTSIASAAPANDATPEALVARGDREMDEATRDPSHLTSAQASYEEALRTPGSRVFGYAAYKLAHVYWALSDFERALSMFQRAITFGAEHPDVQGATTIREAALRDVIPVFAVRGDPAKSYPFFRYLSGDDARARRMQEALGREYDSAGKFADAKTVFADLKRRDPAHTCRWDVLDRYASPTANRATLDADLAKCPP